MVYYFSLGPSLARGAGLGQEALYGWRDRVLGDFGPTTPPDVAHCRRFGGPSGHTAHLGGVSIFWYTDWMATKVRVIGEKGVVGSLALRILAIHPEFEFVDDQSESDAAIVAIPDSGEAVDFLIRTGVRVVDISPTYRLGRDDHARWYGHLRNDDLAKDAVVGLPEFEKKIADAQLVVLPGCYTTAVALALAPLIQKSAFTEAIIDAKEGASGAGKKGPSFIELIENSYPYAVQGHRHQPEMETLLGIPIRFTPHLIPIGQGLLASCYLQGVDLSSISSIEVLREVYNDFYENKPFIQTLNESPRLSAVRATNECHILPVLNERYEVTIFAALDNLWKGAAGQAIQCLNLMYELDETLGLLGNP